MTRLIRCAAVVVFAGAAAAHLFNRQVSAAAVVTQVFPLGGAAGGPWVIAVLSDHYGPTTTDQNNFESDVTNLFVNGLLADANFTPYKNLFTIKAIYNPFPSTDPLHPPLSQNSNYGFEAQLSGNCEVSSLGVTTASAVEDVAAVVGPTRIVVLGNYTFDSGCTDYNWTYLYARAIPRTVAHEFGHLLVKLFDEYVTHPGPDPNAPIDRKNCSTSVSAPYWTSLSLPGITNPSGCDTFSSGIVRPSDSCLMLNYGLLCSVCQRLMGRGLASRAPSAPRNLRIKDGEARIRLIAQTPPETHALRVLVSLNRDTGAVDVLTANEVAAPSVEQTASQDDYIYEVHERGTTIAAGVIGGDPFESRSFKEPRAPHGTAQRTTATFVVTIPSMTKRDLLSRALDVEFFQISSPRDEDVTAENLARLKRANQLRSIAVLGADALRKVAR